MRFLVHHRLIPFAIQPKSSSPEQICYKKSQDITLSSLRCLLFSTSKNKSRKYVKRISKSATYVVLALKFLWTSSLFFLGGVLKFTI